MITKILRKANIMLRLRPYKACDANMIVSWIKDEVSFHKWCADRFEHYPITGEDLNNYYQSFACANNFFQMTAFNESEIVGHLLMRFIDEEQKILRFGFVIVDDTKRGKGYGKKMLQLAIQFAFDIVKAEKITIGVFDNNESAYHCYKAVGFQDIGQVQNYYILGEEWKCKELELGKRF